MKPDDELLRRGPPGDAPLRRPDRLDPDAQPRAGSSWFAIIFAACLGMGLIVGLMLLALVWSGAVVVIAAVFGVGIFHYLFWGWWLSKTVRDDEAENRPVDDR